MKNMIKLYCDKINELGQMRYKIVRSGLSKNEKNNLINNLDDVLFEKYKKIEDYIKTAID